MDTKTAAAVLLPVVGTYLLADVARHYHGASVDQLPTLTVPSSASANTDTGDTISVHDTITGVKYGWEVRSDRRRQTEQDT